MKKVSSLVLLVSLMATGFLHAGEEQYDVKGKYMESCACDVVCPCLFGGKPTQGKCNGQGLLMIKEGKVDGVDLSGLNIHVAFQMGAWEKYTVSEDATAEQMKAARKLIEEELNFMDAEIVGIEKGKITHDVSTEKVSFSTEDSKVVMEMVAGADGTPIRIENHEMFPGYQQYRSTVNRHSSEQGEFSLSGTNGLVAKKLIDLD